MNPCGLIPPATLCVRASSAEDTRTLVEVCDFLNGAYLAQIQPGHIAEHESPDHLSYNYISLVDLPEEAERIALERLPAAAYLPDAFRQFINRYRTGGGLSR